MEANEETDRGLPLGVVIVVAGLLVVVVGAFLPQGVAEEAGVELWDNMLVADVGIAVMFGAGVLVTGLMTWFWWSRGDVSWIATLVFGLAGALVAALMLWAVYEDAVWSDIAGREIETRAGAGAWAVLAGTVVVVVGALLMRPAEPAHRARVRRPGPLAAGGMPPQSAGSPQAWPAQKQQAWPAETQQAWPAEGRQGTAGQHPNAAQRAWPAAGQAPAAQQPAWSPPPAQQLPPAGWYPDPQPPYGTAPGQRWWDGRQWTDARAPAQPPAPAQPAPPAPRPPAGPESPGSLWSGPRDDYR